MAEKLRWNAEGAAQDRSPPDYSISRGKVIHGPLLASVRIEIFADASCRCGRGATLGRADEDAAVRRLDRRVWSFATTRSGAKLGSFCVGQEVGAVVPRRSGGLVLAVRDGIGVSFDAGVNFALTAPVESDIPGNRMNDAKCDPAGRLLAGTTAFDFAPHSAALYRIEPDWSFGHASPRRNAIERHRVEPRR